MRLLAFAFACLAAFAAAPAAAADAWIATWIAAQQGPFATPDAPSGLAAPGDFQGTIYFMQPDAVRWALPKSTATDQSFRMIVRPDLWGDTMRVRFSNVFGKEPLTIGSAALGLQEYAASLIDGTAIPVTFGGSPGVTIPPGERVFSDPIKLGFVTDADKALLRGRNLAISFSVTGSASALSHHGTAYQTSYISAPGAGDVTGDASGVAFPYTTNSWFIVDGLDVMAAEGTPVVVAVGDSITDGTLSTNNTSDRWPDVLSYRLHAAYGDGVSIVNAAINANAVAVDMVGPALTSRLQRDVMDVSGVSAVILLEGINDLGAMGVSSDKLIEAYKGIAAALHAKGIRAVAGTQTPAYDPDQTFATSTLGKQYGAAYGGPATDAARKIVNAFIRTSGTFDAVIDFEVALIDPATGGMKEEYAPNSMGGPGDYLHPNHGGYLAMGQAVDLKALLPSM